MRRFAVVLAFTCALLAAGPAHAQRVLDLQHFTPAPDGDGFLTIPGTRTPGPFNTNFGLYGNYASNLLMLHDALDGSTRPVVSDRIDLDAFFQVGILGRFALVLDAPVMAWQQGNGPFYDGGPGLPVVAIRDPRLAARARLVGEDSTTDRARHEGEGIGLLVATTLPLGMTNSFAGEGAPIVEGALLADFHLLDFGIGGQLGFRHHFAEPSILGVSFRNQLYGSIGVQVPAFFLDHVWAIAEVDVTTDAENPFGSNASTAVEWRLGGRGSIGDAQITVAGGSGLVNGIGAPSGRLIVGITFAPRVHDRDGDHITDDRDACQTLPEDFDQHEDEDGCPEPDNDGDLVPDLDDHCPNEASDFEHDADEDGCTDPIVDSDGDGRNDDVDACTAEAEDADGFQDDDGCPDPDNDGDRVPDASDTCPMEAEDWDEHDDTDGCPDLDDDGDGVPDTSDACDAAAEDVDGHDDTDGCPDPDDDHDGVLDANDRCPAELETINGVTDDDGCPDAGRGHLRAEGTRGGDDFRVTGTLRFAADGSLPASQAALLDELATWLRADPGLAKITLGERRWLPAYETALREALAARGVTQALTIGNWDPSLPAHRLVASHPQTLHLQQIEVQPAVPSVTRALAPALAPTTELVEPPSGAPATSPAPSGTATDGTVAPEAP